MRLAKLAIRGPDDGHNDRRKAQCLPQVFGEMLSKVPLCAETDRAERFGLQTVRVGPTPTDDSLLS